MLTVITANIGRHVGHAEAAANVRKVRRAGSEKPLVFLQEIDEYDGPDEHKIVENNFRRGYTHAGFATMVPTMVPKPWVIERAEVSIASPGRAKVSPHRIVNEALIRNKDRPTLPAIAFLGGHFAYKADDLWAEAFEKWTERVAYYADRGHTVIGGMDSNHHGQMDKLHPDAKWIPTGGSIDRLFYVQRSVKVDVEATGSIDLTIDGHDARWARLTLSKSQR